MRRTGRCLVGVGLLSLLITTSCDGGDEGSDAVETTNTETTNTSTTASGPTSSVVVDVTAPTGSSTPTQRGDPIARLVRRQVGADDLPPGRPYRRFDALTDATGEISIEVPASWTERDLAPHLIDSEEEAFIEATPDREAFREAFDVPGVQFSTLSSSTTVDVALAGFGFSDSCEDRGEREFESRSFTGKLQVWHDCGGTTASIVIVAANPADGSVTTVILAQVVTRADLAALDRAVATFDVIDD